MLARTLGRMTSLAAALYRTLGHEGGISDDPADRGGLTYRGIARRRHPDWRGWPIVDARLAAAGTVRTDDAGLAPLVQSFYAQTFWAPLRAGEYPTQDVAEEMFDSGVNVGIGRAARWLQRALNALNRQAAAWPDVSVDGQIGGQTLAALRACHQAGRTDALLKLLNALQGVHYLDLAENDPTQERFMGGWLARVWA